MAYDSCASYVLHSGHSASNVQHTEETHHNICINTDCNQKCSPSDRGTPSIHCWDIMGTATTRSRSEMLLSSVAFVRPHPNSQRFAPGASFALTAFSVCVYARREYGGQEANFAK